MDKEIAKIILFLGENTNFSSKTAATGSLYIDCLGLKIRISDHEEANTRLRESAHKCFYLRTADNQTFTSADVLFDVFHYLEYEAGFVFTQELKTKLYDL